jgi:hypothetical protein
MEIYRSVPIRPQQHIDLPISLSASQSSGCLDFIKAIMSLISGLLPSDGISTMASVSVDSSILPSSVSDLYSSSNDGEFSRTGLTLS